MRIPALLACLMLAAPALAGSPAVYEQSAKIDADTAYDKLNAALEQHGYYVIFEPNIGKNLQGMAAKLGADYNRNQLTTIKSLVFCNPRYANEMSNLDPAMLALCPMHVTLTHKGDITSVYFIRTSMVTHGSAGDALGKKIEADVIAAIGEALHGQ
jgi:Domain of unknown function DUF302.